MKQKSEIKTRKISRNIIIGIYTLFFISAGIGGVIKALGLMWKPLEVFGVTLFALSALLLLTSGLTPGALLILQTPWLAHAWLQGARLFDFSYTPWDELSSSRKINTYFYSILISTLTLVGIIELTIQAVRK